MNDINSLVLIYQNENGDLFEQRAIDLVSSGTLSDADTGEDLELIGWKESNQNGLPHTDPGIWQGLHL